MATARDGPYVWVTWLTKILAGEEYCRWKLWFRSHHTYDKQPSDFDFDKWISDHGRLVFLTSEALREEGYGVSLEGQNEFRLVGKNGATVSGKPDIVANRDGELLIVDCKTGKERGSHKIQVMLYMLMLPAGDATYRDMRIAGRVQYQDQVVPIPAEAVGVEFKGLVKDLMDMAAGAASPATAPSFGECRFCDITAADCPDRIDEEQAAVETDLF